MNFASVAPDLKLDPDGVWRPQTKSQSISYPEHGHFDTFQLEDNSFWYRHRRRCFLELARKYSIEGPFLDVGGGNGFMTSAVTDLKIEAVLLEPGSEGVANATRRGIKNIVQGSIETAGIKPDSFSSAGLFDVIEHLEDDQSFLIQVHHCLKEKGQLYLTTPLYRFLWSNEDAQAGHFRRYGFRELLDKVRRAGFEVKFATPIFSPLVAPIFLKRTLGTLLHARSAKTAQGTYKQEHLVKGSPLSLLLEKMLDIELRWILQGHSLPFGSSGLIVAQKHQSGS